MKSRQQQHDVWRSCPSGQVQRLVDRLQAKRRAAMLRRTGGLAAAGVLTALFAGIYLYARDLNHAPDYGGIACRNVLASAEEYLAGTLDDDTKARIDKHVELCTACRARLAALRRTVNDEPCHGAPGCDPAQSSEAVVGSFRKLRSRCD